ncbi:polysaccharide export outer membrane protein [Persicobacter psychrovividus]|uniref:Polysaccharide export outer membrane protein n=2 Tax=Persicobacter psychrovividus TaxID=387638 RepID=A0ABN6L668_9BACT|nr:polysaccharide export outer membrane protein [Persicobacter psychrovividus]
MRQSLAMLKPVLLLVLFCSMFSSCITRKKITYLQDAEGRKGLPTDEVIRSFDRTSYDFKLKGGDLISIKIGSLTSTEYDFINQYAVQMGSFMYLSRQTMQNNSAGGQTGMRQQQMMNQMGGQMVGDDGKPIAQGDPQATGFLLNDAGEVNLPKIGLINLEGQTLAEAEDIIEEKLKGLFEAPQVRVQILNFRFTVLGEVDHQGVYTTYKDKTTLFEAVAMAGTPGEFSDRSELKIVREHGGQTEVAYVNLLSEDFLKSPYYYIQPNDVIVVPPMGARSFRKYGIQDALTTVTFLTSIVSLIALIRTIQE